MASLVLKNFAAFVQEQAANIQGRATQLLDFSVGSVLRAIIESNAGVGLWLQSDALRVLATTRAATSTGDDLDSWVGDFGLLRLGAQVSVGTVTFARFTPSAQAVIPVGTTVQTLDGTVNFQVVADPSNTYFNSGFNGYVLGAGIASIDVPVAAVTPGAAANVKVGTVGVITSTLNYVDTVTNAGNMTGGGNKEADASLRERFINYIQSLTRGTVPAILFAATNVRLGLQATCIENENADLSPNSGFLCVTVSTSETDPLVDDVTFTEVRAQVEAYRAGGIWVGVFQVIPYYLSVQMNLTIAPGYEYQFVVGLVGETVRGFLNSMKIGQTLSLTKLAQVAYECSPGILNVTNILINGETNDVVASPRVIIRALDVVVA